MTRFLLLLVAIFSVTSPAAHAKNASVGQIAVQHAWAPATPDGFQPKRSEWDPDLLGEVYLTIANAGAEDRLVVVATDPGIADSVELRRHKVDHGVMQIDAIDGGIVLPGGQTLDLPHEGIHVILTGLKAPLEIGEHMPLTLTFEKAGRLTVDLVVAASSADRP
ncbi:copper chaperone PCu(A)C [Rhizobium sp. P38BS-XIX]|uniref:copper chaperone PCu(A)C n=1 Tax=Rhizobium sp. P38BS-XIX TaxID=2726740 RepID=UPI00145645BD|nr:copper chaperone PCu(A)C [Rhizobium sp. P38BS-XIX]NLS01562.1 copper chaperone PCu(A)C [Rhizobium sp. P38BS-XIX]